MLLRLPLDVIHHVIRHMLDYESNVCLNRVLPPHERRCTQMTPSACISHQIRVSCLTIGSVMSRMNDTPGSSAARAACYYRALTLSITPPHTLLIRHHPLFTNTLLTKAHQVLRDRGTAIMLAVPRAARKRLYRAASRVIRVAKPHACA